MTKRWLILCELLQSCASTFFLYGEPFYAHRRYHWSANTIALTQVLSGLCIAAGAFLGGQIAHRLGTRRAMQSGVMGCALGVTLGLVATPYAGVAALTVAIALISFSQALVWPGIEAALMHGATREGVQRYVGYYNLTWSFGTATAFFVTTPILAAFGLNALFVAPALLFGANLILLWTALPQEDHPEPAGEANEASAEDMEARHMTDGELALYRRLGWIANPAAYVAIMVVVTYNPTIGARLGLSFGAMSIWCSVWFYARMATFELLRRWRWWHYRWRFLCGVFGLMMLSFLCVVLAPNIVVLLVAQVAFGMSAGVIYQSSLFYSMAGSRAQGAHGGFHECFIGFGVMTGPLIAYAGSWIAPHSAALPIGLVLALMAAGLGALFATGMSALRLANRVAEIT